MQYCLIIYITVKKHDFLHKYSLIFLPNWALIRSFWAGVRGLVVVKCKIVFKRRTNFLFVVLRVCSSVVHTSPPIFPRWVEWNWDKAGMKRSSVHKIHCSSAKESMVPTSQIISNRIESNRMNRREFKKMRSWTGYHYHYQSDLI